MRKRGGGAGTVAALALTCVLAVTLLLSLAAGAAVYRAVAVRVEESGQRRVGLAYIAAKVRGFDQAGAVRAGTFGGQDALYLFQELDGLTYETILYVYDGYLMELFCEAGWELAPEDGQRIAPARALTVEAVGGGLLRLGYTGADGGEDSALLAVRSAGGEEA